MKILANIHQDLALKILYFLIIYYFAYTNFPQYQMLSYNMNVLNYYIFHPNYLLPIESLYHCQKEGLEEQQSIYHYLIFLIEYSEIL